MKFLPTKEIIFQKVLIKEELTRDELESKFCKLFGLNEYCEYIFLYHKTDIGYHCISINKENLRQYTKTSSETLTHPIFIIENYTQENETNFIITTKEEIQIVKYDDKFIIDFEVFNNIDNASHKINHLDTTNTYVWNLDTNIDNNLLKRFNKLDINLDKLQNILNLNQLPPNTSIFKKPIFYMIISAALGILCGISYPSFLYIKQKQYYTETLKLQQDIRERTKLKEESIKEKIKTQNDIKNLKQKILDLQNTYSNNAKTLDLYNKDLKMINTFYETYETIKTNQHKIKYYHQDKLSTTILISNNDKDIAAVNDIKDISNIQNIKNSNYILVEINNDSNR